MAKIGDLDDDGDLGGWLDAWLAGSWARRSRNQKFLWHLFANPMMMTMIVKIIFMMVMLMVMMMVLMPMIMNYDYDAYNFVRKLGKKKQRFRLWRQKFLSGLSAIGLDVEEVRKFNDKEKTFWSIIKFCLAICKLTNIPIFAIYIYGISHHVCLLIHVQRASLKHIWPPTKEGQSNKVQKPNRTIPLHSISLPLLSQEVNSEGRNNVHFIKLHAPWPLLCRYTGRLLSGNVVPCTNALDHGLFCVVEVGS